MTGDPTRNRTLDQERAEHALKEIKKIENKEYGHYVSYVSSLPATIVMNGLGQALVTLLAKAKGNSKDPHKMLFDHIAGWLCVQVPKLRGRPDSIIEKMMEQNQAVYIHAQAESMAYLSWLKQFARAYLKEERVHND